MSKSEKELLAEEIKMLQAEVDSHKEEYIKKLQKIFKND